MINIEDFLLIQKIVKFCNYLQQKDFYSINQFIVKIKSKRKFKFMGKKKKKKTKQLVQQQFHIHTELKQLLLALYHKIEKNHL